MSRTVHRRAAFIGRASILALAACVACGAAIPQAAFAQSGAASQRFDIAAGDLSAALSQFGEKTGLALVYPAELASGKRTSGVSGTMTATEALSRLLSGTGLIFRFNGGRTLVIEAASADGERVTGAVRVEGLEGSPYFGGAGQMAGVNGVNGSRDITATEGTKSFTSGALTIGSKVPQAMKDVPQSVSVLTSERMEQQNVTDFTTAMKQLPGVTLAQGSSSLESKFYSRGFEIQSIQVDGGAPLITGSRSLGAIGYYPQLDMAQYDHVEILRGASGTLNGFGDPSGTVNLVRKKPLDHAQVLVEGQLGSWSSYRVMVDGTSPIALGGRLRGRLVMTYQDNHYFYDTAKDRKTLLYGIAELDATPTTLVTGGISYSNQDSVPWVHGLPRYQTGADIGLPRSTSFVFPWNRWDFNTTELFGAIQQAIGSDWTAKINLTHSKQQSIQKLGTRVSAVNPLNGTGPYLNGTHYNYASKQLSIEATLSGSFDIFGQRQEITVGANHVDSDGGGRTIYDGLISTYLNPYQPYSGGPVYCQDFGFGGCPSGSIPVFGPPIDVFNFDPNDPRYSEPRNTLANSRYPEYGEVQSGAYINLRLTAFDRLHLTAGLRWNRYEYNYAFDELCTRIPASDPGYSPSCFGKQIGDVFRSSSQGYSESHMSWPPSASLSFDVTPSISAYAGYTDIYQSLATAYDADHKPLDPITGSNIEIGMKWAPRGGRINASIAAYQIKQNGFALYDPTVPFEQIAPGVYCCYVKDKGRTQKSEGIDLEVTGEIFSGLQIAGSYTYGRTKQKGSYFGDQEGQPFTSIQPKHSFKIWASYDFKAAGRKGPLSGLTLSGGLNGQSSAYYAGSVCVNLAAPDPVTGISNCLSSGPPDYVPFEFTVPGYALLAARIDYTFSPAWSFAVNLENLLDKTYYQSVGTDPTGGNWYGAPRSVTATLRGKW